MEAGVTRVIPCNLAFPALVALGISSVELGAMNTCLKPCRRCYLVLRNDVDPYRDQEVATQKSSPWVLRIVLPVTVEEDRPIGASSDDFLVLKGVTIAKTEMLNWISCVVSTHVDATRTFRYSSPYWLGRATHP